MMFERLAEIGRGDIVRAALGYLAGALDENLDTGSPAECLATVDAELLADFGAVSRLREGIDDELDPEEVADLTQAAIEEIGRTLAKYKIEHSKKEKQG